MWASHWLRQTSICPRERILLPACGLKIEHALKLTGLLVHYPSAVGLVLAFFRALHVRSSETKLVSNDQFLSFVNERDPAKLVAHKVDYEVVFALLGDGPLLRECLTRNHPTQIRSAVRALVEADQIDLYHKLSSKSSLLPPMPTSFAPDSNNLGKTLLHLACSGTMTKLVVNNALLHIGSERLNVDVQDVFQETPLFAGSRRGRASVVRELLLFGADPTVKNWKAENLHLVAQNGSVVRELLNHGVSARSVNMNGRTALHNANDKLSVELLVAAGASVNFKTLGPDPETPLHSALRNGKWAVALALAKCGADFDISCPVSQANWNSPAAVSGIVESPRDILRRIVGSDPHGNEDLIKELAVVARVDE